MLALLIGLAFFVVASITALILYARWNYGVLESLGITVVKPLHPFLGTTYNWHLKITHLEDVERFKKYGPVFGVYEGREAQVHICDAELIQYMMVNDYEHFNDKRSLDFGSALFNESIDILHGDKWSFVRRLLTPTFTPAKIKTMSSSMTETLVEFEDNLKVEISASPSVFLEKYNLGHSLFSMLTKMIMRCVFNTEIGNDESSKYFEKIITETVEGDDGSENNSFMKPLALSFPFLSWFMSPILGTQASEKFVTAYKGILDVRRKSGIKKKDFVGQTINWMDSLETSEFKANGINELTVLAQALFFFVIGPDQVSMIVTHTVRSVCRNENIEKAVYSEMELFLKKHDNNINFDNVSELVYLKACIYESLRLSPMNIRAERLCTKDWEKNGVKIKKGVTVIFPLWACHRNPEYFPDPETYDPERFMPENKDKIHPYALSAFGHGPKNCVAMKFASKILILTAAHLFKNFRFKARPDSEIIFHPGHPIAAIHEPTYFDVSVK